MGKNQDGEKTIKDRQKKTNRRKQSFSDRRKEEDRRRVYSIDYFSMNGAERRKRKDRRKQTEKRKGWERINKWMSIFTGRNRQP